MYTYKQLETAIRSLHDVPAGREGTFKARIRHFQRLGMVPSSPGKGRKIAYTVPDAIYWALLFEFTELGLTPDVIKSLIGMCGRSLLKPFEGPVQDEDQIFWLRGEFLSWQMSHEHGLLGRATSGIVPVSRAVAVAFEENRRVLMLNMTKLKRELGKALDIEWG